MIKTIVFLTALLLPTLAYADEVIAIRVNGMVCDFCARAVEQVFDERDEVKSVKVDLSKKMVTVTVDQPGALEDQELRELIKDAGYDLVEIERSEVE